MDRWCYDEFKKNGVLYTENKLIYVLESPVSKQNNFTGAHNFKPYSSLPEELVPQMDPSNVYSGPQFNLDLRRSRLADVPGSPDFCGIYAREPIKAGSFLGHYIGLHGFGGASIEEDDMKLTKYEFDYMYECDRDYIDAGMIRNFGPFLNHQDLANIDGYPFFVKTSTVVANGAVSSEEAEKLPIWTEIMGLFVNRDIAVGEELYLDYGEKYWDSKDYDKIFLHDFATVVDQLKRSNERVDELEEKLEHVEMLADKLKRLIFTISRNLPKK